MNRREFIQSSAGLALFAAGGHAAEFAQVKPRVGLIGTGWYGKCDLFRLIQVAPVEVVSLCDVDKQLLAEAAGMVVQRQASKKTPRTYSDYRQMLKERDLDIVLIATPDHWHALPMI
ncbi:MAG: Gfo/Idh/MocA family oxidoreductase, partial [Pyrinomonadaceae bacterium]